MTGFLLPASVLCASLIGLALPVLPAAAQEAAVTQVSQDAPDSPLTGISAPTEANLSGKPSDRKDAIEVSDARQKMYGGMLDAQDKKFGEAIPKLEWAIAADPTLLGAWETLGWSYWNTERKEDARLLWERLLTIAPNEPMGYNLLATIYTSKGELDRAEGLYENSLRLNPDQYDTRFSYARVLLWNGKREHAVKELQALFRENPDRTDVEIDLAWALYANEDYEAALEHWDNINELVPDDPDYLLARAQNFLLVGDLTGADEEAQRVIKLDPNNTGALNLLADVAIRTRHPEEAVKALRRVIDMAEDDRAKARITRNLAGYIKNMHDRDKNVFTLAQVRAVAKEAFDLDPDDINGRLFYAEILVGEKDYAAAARQFSHILEKINPFSERARDGLMETYFGRHMLEEAQRQLEDNLRTLNPSDPLRHLPWARLHMARGNFPMALESLDRLEKEGAQGAVFTLLYHGLSPSEWTDMPSVRQFRDQLMALRRAGYRFITPDEIPTYFRSRKAPAISDERPALNQAVQGIKYAWTGEKGEEPKELKDISPERIACITFDDGLRASFRYATPVAEELQIRMGIFVPVGLILDRDMYVASFPEIREYLETGRWMVGSHLMDASDPAPVDKDGRLVHPLPNLIWKEDKNRRENLREYNQRLRSEFRESRTILQRELKVDPDEVMAVAFPMGDIGQGTVCNVDLFNVPEAILNEAEISYRIGFVQGRYGHSIKSDHPMLYKRFEPSRTASGQEVLNAALINHPLFLARRTRIEMAALQGQLHLALDNLALLKRDGYPEQALAEVEEYVQQHLARLTKAPESVMDETENRKERMIDLAHPYLGIEGSSMQANEMIQEDRVSLKAGFNINPSVTMEIRGGIATLKQTVTTNNWIRSTETVTETVREDVVTVATGTVSTVQETRTTYTTTETWTNDVNTTHYKAKENQVGIGFNIMHRSGSLTVLDARMKSFDGNDWDQVRFDSADGPSDEPVWAIEHQWRPTLAIDMAARYQHDVVPSARDIITYDSLTAKSIWRAKDWWHISGVAYFSEYEDNNAYLHADLENFWRLSMKQDLWLGFHNSLDTMDMHSDFYWSPYWDQRHYFILRLRRSYPNYFGMIRVNMGWQKSDTRPLTADEINALTARGETEFGEESDWKPLIGIGGSITRKWDSGWELSCEASVNSLANYTERIIQGSLLYRF